MKQLGILRFFAVLCLFSGAFAQDYNDIDAVSSASLQVYGGRAYEDRAEINFEFEEDIHGDESGKYGRCDLRWGKSTRYDEGDISMEGYDKRNNGRKTITGLDPDTKYYYWIYLSHEDGTSELKGEFTTFAGVQITLSSIEVTPGSASKEVGQTQQFTATGKYSDGSTQDISRDVNWSSSSNQRATISGSGRAEGVSVGDVTITASLDGIDGTAKLTVSAVPVTLSSLEVTSDSSSISTDETIQFTATGTFSDESTQDISADVTWSSSNNSIATISNSGLASGVREGTVTITASLDGVDGTAELDVTDPVVLSAITITPGTITVTSIEGVQLSAEGAFSDGSSLDMTSEVIWQILDPTIAEISNGVLIPLKGGKTEIFATQGSIFQSAPLIVEPYAEVGKPLNPSGVSVVFDAMSGELKIEAALSSVDYHFQLVNARGVTVHAANLSGKTHYTWRTQKMSGKFHVILRNTSTGKIINKTQLVLF